MIRTTTRAALAALLLAAAVGANAQVEARAAWVRGTVAGQTTAGAYMELTSESRASLLGAETPAAGGAEIHEMRMEGNVMRMRAVPRLELLPGKTVELKPGSFHVMFVGLKKPLSAGEHFKATLFFEKAGSVTVDYDVRAMGGQPSGAMPGMKH